MIIGEISCNIAMEGEVVCCGDSFLHSPVFFLRVYCEVIGRHLGRAQSHQMDDRVVQLWQQPSSNGISIRGIDVQIDSGGKVKNRLKGLGTSCKVDKVSSAQAQAEMFLLHVSDVTEPDHRPHL
jgi:hypothetical protein